MNKVKPITPALVVVDAHMAKRDFAKIRFPDHISFSGSDIRGGVGKTVELIEFAKRKDMPIIFSIWNKCPGIKLVHDLWPDVKEAVRDYRKALILEKIEMDFFSGTDAKRYLDSHDVDTLVLAGGDKGVCLLDSVRASIMNGYGVLASDETMYMNRFSHILRNQDIGALIDDFRAIYASSVMVDDAPSRLMLVYDIHNFITMLSFLEHELAEDLLMPETVSIWREQFGVALEYMMPVLMDQRRAIEAQFGKVIVEKGRFAGRLSVDEFYRKHVFGHDIGIGSLMDFISERI